MLPLFKACQEIQGEVMAEKLFRAVSVVVGAGCLFMGCLWALSFCMVALVLLEATCCHLYLYMLFLSIPDFMGDLEKGTALRSPWTACCVVNLGLPLVFVYT